MGFYSRIAYDAAVNIAGADLASKMKLFQKDTNQQSGYQETAGQDSPQPLLQKKQQAQGMKNTIRRPAGQKSTATAGVGTSQKSGGITETTDWQNAVLLSEIISAPVCRKRHGRGRDYGNQGDAGR